MEHEILSNLNNPAQLEQLYRADRSGFKRAFRALYPDIKDNSLTSFWNERLNFTKDDISWDTGKDLVLVIIAALLAGTMAKLPAFLHINEEFFYTRNAGFIIFPALSAYFAWKNKLSIGKIAFIAGATLASSFFINYFPDLKQSDTLILSCIYLIVFLWSILGFAFVGEANNHVEKRLAYLSYNGDLVVMTTLILIAGGILTAATIGLFQLIGFHIEQFYFQNVVVFGLPIAPILGTYLIRTNPQLVGKISPVIAKIFSPLVLVMLAIYLVAIIYSGKNPYNDRDFLLTFNGLLIGVMAIIFFSVAETSRGAHNQPQTWILFLLSALTIIVNGVALSAIVFRISTWGITPNRAAVLGSNVLVLINLLLVATQFFRMLARRTDIRGVKKVIALYLPVYCAWAAIVAFAFPYIFGFK